VLRIRQLPITAGLALVVFAPASVALPTGVIGQSSPAAPTVVATAGAPQPTAEHTADPLANWPPKTVEPTAVPSTAVPTPSSDTPAVPVTQVTAAAAATSTCEQIAVHLAAGNLATLQSVPAPKRETILRNFLTVRALTCLAIADDDSRYCDVLPNPAQDKCATDWKLTRGLRALPKNAIKPTLMYQMCLEQQPSTVCEKLRKGLIDKDPTQCAGIPDRWLASACSAMATGDASKCDQISGVGERAMCAALATGDVGRCPNDSADCISTVRTFAKVEQDGAAALEELDPSMKAASKGRQACAPFLNELQSVCAESLLPIAQQPTPRSPNPTPPTP